MESFSGGQRTSSLKGRAELESRFGAFLAGFDTVYHINGQQTVELQGDRATGTSYCLVVLIGNQGGKRVRTTSGVIYDDRYVRRGGRWLIARHLEFHLEGRRGGAAGFLTFGTLWTVT